MTSDVWSERADWDVRSDAKRAFQRSSHSQVASVDTAPRSPRDLRLHVQRDLGFELVARRARPPTGYRAALGHLEREVMDIVWNAEGDRGVYSHTVRDVQRRLPRKAAYTAMVMTTLDRLFKKGLWVVRRREGRAFVYTAVLMRLGDAPATLTGGLLRGLLSNWSWNAARPFLSNLVDAVGEEDSALLDELERLVRDKQPQTRESSEMRLLVSTLVLTLAWFSALNILVIAGMADCRWTPAWSVLCPAVSSVALRPPGWRRSWYRRLRDWRVPAGPPDVRGQGRISDTSARCSGRVRFFGVGLIGGSALRVGPAVRGYARLRRMWCGPARRETPDCQRLRNPGHLARQVFFTRRLWSGRRVREALHARRAGRGSPT